MTPHDHARPVARKTDLVIQEVADEVLVYNLKTHQAHCLNQTAALVWKYCDGQKTVVDIVGLIKQEQQPAIDESLVWLAVDQLSKANLLEAQLARPAGIPHLSRRETIKRLGVGFALAVPMVMSIVAPAAAAAASGCVAQLPGNTCLDNPGSAANCLACTDILGRCWNSNSNCNGPVVNNIKCVDCPNGNSWSRV